MTNSTARPNRIQRAIQLLCEPGTVVELRALDATEGHRTGTWSGYYDDFAALARAAGEATMQLRGTGVYVTINSCDAALLSRSKNKARFVGKNDSLTSDKEVTGRRWLPVDFDATRPSGISSTDQEHDAALARGRACYDWLIRLGFSADSLVLADSGNGGHVLIRVDLGVTATDHRLVEACLGAVASRFGDDEVLVDESVGNLARIWKLYGTIARKGDNTPERPHRRAEILLAPDTAIPASRDLLVKLAGFTPDDPDNDPARRPPTGRWKFDVGRWIAVNEIRVLRDSPWGEKGHKWVLETCPWDTSHTNAAAFIVQHPNGAISAGCHHDSCSTMGWHDLRDAVEPGWRQRPGLGDQARHAGENDHLNLDAVRLDGIEREEITWFWKPYVAIGKVALFLGDPGIGKGWACASITASATKGTALPDGSSSPECDVLIINAEDGPADTLRPRIEAFGGDLTRVHVVSTGFALNDVGLAAVEREVARLAPGLVIIDPFTAFAGAGRDLNRGNETRPIFGGLAAIAARHRCALIVVAHPNKADQARAIYRASGSIDIVAACRSIALFGADPEDYLNRAMIHIKSNLGPIGPSLGYTLKSGGLIWTGESALTADRVFAKSRSGAASALGEAEEYLRGALAQGARRSEDVKREADAREVSQPTLRRAVKRLKVVVEPVMEEGRVGVQYWTWRLSESPTADASADESPFDESPVDDFGKV